MIRKAAGTPFLVVCCCNKSEEKRSRNLMRKTKKMKREMIYRVKASSLAASELPCGIFADRFDLAAPVVGRVQFTTPICKDAWRSGNNPRNDSFALQGRIFIGARAHVLSIVGDAHPPRNARVPLHVWDFKHGSPKARVNGELVHSRIRYQQVLRANARVCLRNFPVRLKLAEERTLSYCSHLRISPSRFISLRPESIFCSLKKKKREFNTQARFQYRTDGICALTSNIRTSRHITEYFR